MANSSYLLTVEYFALNAYLGAFNLEVMDAKSDTRQDEEIARDIGIKYKGIQDRLYEHAEKFLAIEPWPWEEISVLTEREFRDCTHARSWLVNLLEITRKADKGPVGGS